MFKPLVRTACFETLQEYFTGCNGVKSNGRWVHAVFRCHISRHCWTQILLASRLLKLPTLGCFDLLLCVQRLPCLASSQPVRHFQGLGLSEQSQDSAVPEQHRKNLQNQQWHCVLRPGIAAAAAAGREGPQAFACLLWGRTAPGCSSWCSNELDCNSPKQTAAAAGVQI